MKVILAILLFASITFPQNKLTKTDQDFAAHIKQVWANTNKSNYQKEFGDLIVECNNYLKVYPNTAIKPGVLGYVFEMIAATSRDGKNVRKAGDILLKNDNSFKTSMRVAQILIEKKFDDKRGIEIIKSIMSRTPDKNKYYDANLLLASGELHLKNYQSSINALNAAIKSDSTRIDGYKGLVQVLSLAGQKEKLPKVNAKIKYLEVDPNINVDLSALSIFDIYENRVNFKDFEGKIVAMVFFRFECPYCRKEMPVFKELINKYPDIKFVFVNLEETVPDIKLKYLKESEFSFLKDQTIIKFTDLFDKILDITITPQTLILDKNLVVKFDHRGYFADFAEKFESEIKTLK